MYIFFSCYVKINYFYLNIVDFYVYITLLQFTVNYYQNNSSKIIFKLK